ncbi:type II toxin-antitoxin system RelE/ParE family toxin [Tautonia sp. JC769]|uniref:type II toxin-antitoxin system RelE/ParE family toxin n=1 Tax=Tautonia sp. JC769 TaxID=3232135 RepID=UPI00345B36E7
MRLRWTTLAQADLFEISDYLMDRNPQAAIAVEDRILLAAEALLTFPRQGRPGRIAHTRELVLSGLPYLIIYGEAQGEVVLYRIVHAARDIASWALEELE